MITLPIKWIWFSMISRGEKLEEYRTPTAYYVSRFRNLFGCHDLQEAIEDGRTAYVALRNGYRADSPTIYIKASLGRGKGRPEWGAKPEEEYFILHIHEVYTKKPAAVRTIELPQVSEKAMQGVLDFIRDCRADWTHDPSVGLYGPTEEEAQLLDAIEAALVTEEQKT